MTFIQVIERTSDLTGQPHCSLKHTLSTCMEAQEKCHDLGQGIWVKAGLGLGLVLD